MEGEKVWIIIRLSLHVKGWVVLSHAKGWVVIAYVKGWVVLANAKGWVGLRTTLSLTREDNPPPIFRGVNFTTETADARQWKITFHCDDFHKTKQARDEIIKQFQWKLIEQVEKCQQGNEEGSAHSRCALCKFVGYREASRALLRETVEPNYALTTAINMETGLGIKRILALSFGQQKR